MKCGLWVVFLINNSLCLLDFLFKYFACLKIYATFIIVVVAVVVVALHSLLQRVYNTDSSPKLALAFLFVLKVLLLLNLWLFVACSDALPPVFFACHASSMILLQIVVRTHHWKECSHLQNYEKKRRKGEPSAGTCGKVAPTRWLTARKEGKWSCHPPTSACVYII